MIVGGYRDRGVVERDELGLRFAAIEEATGRPVTVRVVQVEVSSEQGAAVAALWAEASGVAGVVASGETESGYPWVVTDGAAVVSLARRLAGGPPLAWTDVLDMAVQVGDGLGRLHARGMVHGGICPAAVVGAGGRWWLTDVGIAAVAGPIPPGDDGARTGAVLRAAPEVVAGRPLTPAADVYALGLTMVEALTGLGPVPWDDRESADGFLVRRRDAIRSALEGWGPPELVEALGAAIDPSLGGRVTLAKLVHALERIARPPKPPVSEPGPVPVPVPADAGSPHAHVLDDDVQFTVYRPGTVPPGQWFPMLAFAHKTDPVVDPDVGPIDPLHEVRRQAERVLGDAASRYQSSAADAGASLPRGSELRFVPRIDGIECNPPERTFLWREPVHREEFRIRADRRLDGQRARGRLSVYLGAVLIADVSLSIRVDSSAPAADTEMGDAVHARPYRKIFVSYSHQDADVVQTVAAFASLTGDEFVRDVTHLRAGQVWSEELARLIDEAQIFQLFWSSNSMVSPYVRDEWTYALSLNRPNFIRPLYWEVPLPERPEDDLPPQALRRIDFDLFSLSPDTVGRVVALMAPRGVVCPTDGHLNDLDARYCVACGTPLPSSGEAIRPPTGGRAPSELPDAPTPTVSAPRPSAPSAPSAPAPPAGGYEPEPHWRTPSPTTGSPGPTVGGRSRSRQGSWVLVAVLVLLLVLVALLAA